MPITILRPAPAPPPASSSADSDDEMDLDPTTPSPSTLLTPGTPLTTDPQFMRGHGTFHPARTTHITSSLLGTLTRTNKLLSITPLSARYAPEIGDLVIGRILEVQSRRWKVDVCASLHANLPLSSINLPGGVQRKRTGVDEQNMRAFFEEGDLLVAEVQALFGDGSAGLHTRSLKYGKLRNGAFVDVGGRRKGVGGGVKRSKRQIFTMDTAAGEVDVVVGVNGFVFVAKRSADERREGTGLGLGVKAEEEGAGPGMYSCQNDPGIDVAMRVEVARIAGCVRALTRHGVDVDEEAIRGAYGAALDIGLQDGVDEHPLMYLGGESGRVVAEMALSAAAK